MNAQAHDENADMHGPVAIVFPLIALSALSVFVVTALAMHALRPDLGWTASQMSVYLVGAWGSLLQAGYVALALGMVALGIGLDRALVPAARSAAPLLLLALAASALAVTAYAPMRFPAEDQRFEHLLHGLAAQTTFLCTTAGMVLQSLRFRRDPVWRPYALPALLMALACFGGVWVLALWREIPRGLAQKALIALIVAWLGTAALRLLWQARHAGAPVR